MATARYLPASRGPRLLALGSLVMVAVIAFGAVFLLGPDGGDDAGRDPARPALSTVRVAALPTDVAAHGGRVWVTSAGSDRVLELTDAARPRTVAEHDVGAGTLRVDAGATGAWTTGAADDTVTRVDRRDAGAKDAISVGADAVDVAVAGNAVWVTNGPQGGVTRIDPVSGRVLGPPVRTGRFPTALAIGSAYVWVVNSGDGTVARVDPREHLVVGRRAGVGRDPQDIAIAFGSVWVANRGDGTLTRIAERTGRPQGTVDVGGSPSALAATAKSLFVLDSARGWLVRLDPRSLRKTHLARIGGYPTALAVSDAGWLFVVDARRGTVSRVDEPALEP